MIKHIVFFILFSLISCFAIAQVKTLKKSSMDNYCQCEQTYINSDTSIEDNIGFKILKVGYQMALIDRCIIKGSCWDFVNEVYRRSGSADTKETIFRSHKKGSFAPSSIVQPGDWIYHINHQFNNSEHSAIFICWKDFEKKIAITLSYAGGNRNLPGHYGEYHIDNIYSIFRPKK
jgi:hypothetical protein